MSINKSYFRRQAPLLRRMFWLTHDPLVADRLSEMARNYEQKASDGSTDELPAAPQPNGDKDPGPKN